MANHLQLDRTLPPHGADVFPSVSNPHLYRQTSLVTCESDGICLLEFDRVAANHLLQIDAVSCGASSGQQGFLLRDPVSDFNHVVAIFSVDGTGTASVQGPFYMAAGERPTIQLNSTNQALCSIFGTLWTTP
jgi:hypothetical protein